MTREEAKELLSVIKAYAEGKTLQIKNKIGRWADLYGPNWDSSPDKYRIKPEPKYRPFKTPKECWDEMQKHQPLGWIKPKDAERFYCITILSANLNVCNSLYRYTEGFNNFTFADGQPFGIKED